MRQKLLSQSLQGNFLKKGLEKEDGKKDQMGETKWHYL